ncbi:PREDICTED: killer cell lectin-like receptor subfamily F member 2 isoform X3 [Bison bison bison]|uniref:Killer cell lectin-like receptor subfamily F member 2 isoform X3 n=1 Tax=Bison bison bison TaxID=43346 RepID=A0A6P3IX89_BISBB|nr:PREDICTED: killer cell lectin-like receptor subfamily F member 2 isoform X3 [Bison bison bison]
MSLFPSHSKMDYSVYRMFGQMQNTEESMMQKPRKHPYHCQHMWTCKDNPKCPKWHQTALRLTSIAMVTLVATVIGLTVWGNHSQNLCPNGWVQKKGKCYNFFKNYQSWIDSQKLCSTMKSHLLVIQDKAELDFLQSSIQDGIYFWIGLNISYPQNTWTWLDGTPLNLQLFQVLGEVEDDACALITKKGVFSEKCPIQNYWICQGVVPSSTDTDL